MSSERVARILERAQAQERAMQERRRQNAEAQAVAAAAARISAAEVRADAIAAERAEMAMTTLLLPPMGWPPHPPIVRPTVSSVIPSTSAPGASASNHTSTVTRSSSAAELWVRDGHGRWRSSPGNPLRTHTPSGAPLPEEAEIMDPNRRTLPPPPHSSTLPSSPLAPSRSLGSGGEAAWTKTQFGWEAVAVRRQTFAGSASREVGAYTVRRAASALSEPVYVSLHLDEQALQPLRFGRCCRLLGALIESNFEGATAALRRRMLYDALTMVQSAGRLATAAATVDLEYVADAIRSWVVRSPECRIELPRAAVSRTYAADLRALQMRTVVGFWRSEFERQLLQPARTVGRARLLAEAAAGAIARMLAAAEARDAEEHRLLPPSSRHDSADVRLARSAQSQLADAVGQLAMLPPPPSNEAVGVDWQRLPEEVLIQIFSHLGSWDVAAAALVCRAWEGPAMYGWHTRALCAPLDAAMPDDVALPMTAWVELLRGLHEESGVQAAAFLCCPKCNAVTPAPALPEIGAAPGDTPPHRCPQCTHGFPERERGISVDEILRSLHLR